MADRKCDRCGGAVPNRMSRVRDDKGDLVCETCVNLKAPDWGSTHASLTPAQATEMRMRQMAALVAVKRVNSTTRVAHDSGDNAIINHCPFCGSGAVMGKSDGTASCDFCHTNFTVQVQPAHPFMPQTVDGQPVPPAGLPGEQPTEMSAPLDPAINEVEEGVVGDAQQAPVGAQPPGGAPVPPGAPKPPAAPGAEKPKPKGKVPPQFAKGSALRTAEGHTLDVEAYMARLALDHADDRSIVLDAVRHENLQREAALWVTCTHCDGSGDEPGNTGVACDTCHGTGTVEAPKQHSADLLVRHDDPTDFDTSPLLVNGDPIPSADLLDPRAQIEDEDLLAANGRTLPDPFLKTRQQWANDGLGLLR